MAGVKRSNIPLFKFIRTFNANIFGNLVSKPFRQQKTNLIQFSRVALVAEFWRLVSTFNACFLIKRRWGIKNKKARFVFLKNKLRKNKKQVLKKKPSVKLVYSSKFFGINSYLLYLPALFSLARKTSVGFALNKLTFLNPLIIEISRFIVKLLAFLVSELNFAGWVSFYQPALVNGLIRVVSKGWGRWLNTFLRTTPLKLGIKSFKVRLLFLNRISPRKIRPNKITLANSNLNFEVESDKPNFVSPKKAFILRFEDKSPKRFRPMDRETGARSGDLKQRKLFGVRQKIRRFWGAPTLRHLASYRQRASFRLRGTWSRHFSSLLDCRLDLFIIRSHLAATLVESRDMIRRGWVLLNGTAATNWQKGVEIGDLVAPAPLVSVPFQLCRIRYLWNCLEEVDKTVFRVWPSYLELNCRRLATIFVSSLFNSFKIPQGSTFVDRFTLTIGRFHF